MTRFTSKNSPRIILLASVLFLAGIANAHSAPKLSSSQASKETEISQLRLVETDMGNPRFNRLGISIGYVEDNTQLGNGNNQCGATSYNRSLKARAVATKAFALLPRASIASSGLKYLIVCSGMIKKGSETGGFPIPPLDLLVVNIGKTDLEEEYVNLIIQHEYFHFMEYKTKSINDAEWQRLFGGQYKPANKFKKSTHIGTGSRGFLNSYSEVSEAEDRAEIFAYLQVMPERVSNHIRQKKDKLLQDKVNYLAKKHTN